MQLIFIALMISVCSLSGCQSESLPKGNNLNNGKILVFGHGGNGFKPFIYCNPINTISSIVKGIQEENADGVELDIQLSRDKQLVLFHDHKLENSTNCEGTVNAAFSTRLLQCQYSSLVCNLFRKKNRVVLLDSVLSMFSNMNPRPYLALDLKLYSPRQQEINNLATSLNSTLLRYDYFENVFIESTSVKMLKTLKKTNNKFNLFIYTTTFKSGLETAQDISLFGITIKNSLVTKQEITQAHQAGFHVTIWGVGSKKSSVEAVRKNPDYIQTDDIPVLRSILYE